MASDWKPEDCALVAQTPTLDGNTAWWGYTSPDGDFFVALINDPDGSAWIDGWYRTPQSELSQYFIDEDYL